MGQKPVKIEKIFAVTLGAAALLIVLFYFLAGDQLHFRQSRGNLELPVADSAPFELTAEVIYEQRFTAQIQRLEAVSVQWGTYYRPNAGAMVIELAREDDGTILLQQAFDISRIYEGQVLTVAAPEPLEGLVDVPLIVRLYSDAQAGAAVTPMLCSTAEKEGFALTVNGSPMPGMLCFAANGEDYIWTGLHYWQFSVLLLAALAAVFAVVILRVRRGQRSYIANAINAVQKYRFLIRQLVARDFKTKYKRSVLGVFWSFLNPLMMMMVQYFVFSTLFRSEIRYFPAYLIIGTVSFNFFSEACGMSLMSILTNAGLITKVYMPKYIYPLTRTMSSGINLLISLIPMLLVCVFTGVRFHKSALLALFFVACLFIFSLGLGMLLSASMVFFRDTQFLWGVLSMIWMYATPIFYPETILPPHLRFVLMVNPLYHFIKNTRVCLLDGISPEPIVYMQCLLIACVMLLVGAVIFKKTQDKFVLFL